MQSQDKKNKRRGLIGTIVFHLILLILFLFTGLTTPVPIPEEEGLPVQLDLGNTDFGQGDEQPLSSTEPEESEPITEPQPVEASPVESPEDVVTQDADSDLSAPEETKPQKPVEKKPELSENLKKVLQSNPFQTKDDNDSKGQGDSDQPGDHGKAEGSPEGNSLHGDAAGGGISFDLGGRSAKNLRAIPGNYQESGLIVIDIVVDREGNVLRASVGRKTTITNASLLKAAEAEARRVKFTPNPSAPEEQRGKISYPIILQ
ncbi:MAG: hypothetical protein RLP15_07105 [Cryomorphaceae bacterium]